MEAYISTKGHPFHDLWKRTIADANRMQFTALLDPRYRIIHLCMQARKKMLLVNYKYLSWLKLKPPLLPKEMFHFSTGCV